MPQRMETLNASIRPRHRAELTQFARQHSYNSISGALRRILDLSPELQLLRQAGEPQAANTPQD